MEIKRDRIKKLVAENRLLEALDDLINLTQEQGGDLESEAILLRSRFLQSVKKDLAGTESNEKNKLTRNMVSKSILDLLVLLANSFDPRKNMGNDIQDKNKTSPKNIINIDKNFGDIHLS